MAKNPIKHPPACPCDSNKAYDNCCQPYHRGLLAAPSAEALMRSRYSAYVLQLEEYLLRTWHPDSRPDHLGLENDTRAKWLGLTVIRHELGESDCAIVEFSARYKIGGKAEKLHETSRFLQINHEWFYVDGTESNST
jgi:SEC-C motif-containing protein